MNASRTDGAAGAVLLGLALAAAGLAGGPAAAAGTRPDPARIDRSVALLQAQHDGLARADADLVQGMRAAFQQGAQDRAKAALVRYANAVQALLSSQPPTPKLGACYARAEPFLAQAGKLETSALADRRAKVQALTGITYRPLVLADFSGVVTAPAAADREARDIGASLKKAQGVGPACRAEEERLAASRAMAARGAP